MPQRNPEKKPAPTKKRLENGNPDRDRKAQQDANARKHSEKLLSAADKRATRRPMSERIEVMNQKGIGNQSAPRGRSADADTANVNRMNTQFMNRKMNEQDRNNPDRKPVDRRAAARKAAATRKARGK